MSVDTLTYDSGIGGSVSDTGEAINTCIMLNVSCNHVPYSQTIFKKTYCLFLQNFVNFK